MGRKSHTKDRDRSEVQRLKHENQKLRKEISRLRKMVSRIEDYHEEVFEQSLQEETLMPSIDYKEQLRKQWKCFSCNEGVLVIWQFDRLDGKFFQRRCSSCKHKTRLKPYTDEVKGIRIEEL